ncbi:MAG: hypothetical protein C4346_07245 [Chloroflexota bacterium]
MVSDLLLHESERDAGSIGHAGEWETSLQSVPRPALVDMSRARADAERPDLSAEVRTSTAFAERRRERAGGVHGDPSVATAAKGERLFLAARDALLRVVQEVRELPVRRYYEFEQPHS